MKKYALIGIVVLLFALGWYVWQSQSFTPSAIPRPIPQSPVPPEYPATTKVVTEGLDTPWEMVFLPDASILVTERKGTVRLINSTGNLQVSPVGTISSVKEIGEGGLLGMALHPDFSENNLVYLYYTYAGEGDSTLNRVVRMIYGDGTLSQEKIIEDAIPGARFHNGGRIAFGPDGFLYITTGDAGEPSEAQNTDSLAGKILRVTDEGDPAPGNPFANEVYSYGHRNPQGLAWDNSGRLWSTEHGRSGILSGYDEVNLIVKGGNYGWPEYQGDESSDGIISPVRHSGATTTWAPAGATVIDSILYFTGLRGNALYASRIDGVELGEVSQVTDAYGRLRIAVRSPDGILYIATSNRDGRGNPNENDDRIIMVGRDLLYD